MNNLKIPFASLDDEMIALQAQSERYQTKIAALLMQGLPRHEKKIRRLERLDHQCQGAIAFCFSRKQPRIQ